MVTKEELDNIVKKITEVADDMERLINRDRNTLSPLSKEDMKALDGQYREEQAEIDRKAIESGYNESTIPKVPRGRPVDNGDMGI